MDLTWYSYIKMTVWYGALGLVAHWVGKSADIGLLEGAGLVFILLSVGAATAGVPGIYFDAKEVKKSNYNWNPSPSIYFFGCVFLTPAIIFPIYMIKREDIKLQ